MPSQSEHDYIILGGGTAGCVLASRLHASLPTASILILERGDDEHSNPLITSLPSPGLTASHLVSRYTTVPQECMNGREMVVQGGNVLSGSSAVNYGGWFRGARGDYERWAQVVGASRFGYEGLLPFFRRSETVKGGGEMDLRQHGSEGPVHTTPGREYPLREKLEEAFEGLGYMYNEKFHDGEPTGLGQWVENWRDGKRQPAGLVYNLSGVEVKTGCVVKRVLLEKQGGEVVATGVEAADGETWRARKEVILCCGSYKTPQILMLSGIGPAEDLARVGIPQVVDSPQVGRNLWDHLVSFHAWKIRRPEEGYASARKSSTNLNSAMGLPIEWIAGDAISTDALKEGLKKQGVESENVVDKLDASQRHVATMVAYLPMGFSPDYKIPVDGSIITTAAFLFQPSSMGKVTIASLDPRADPIIDPQYCSRPQDRVMVRLAVRKALAVMESKAMQDVIEGEYPPEGFSKLSSASTDEEIDGRVRGFAQVINHASGTASLGTVVDSRFCVKGVKGLRIVDASVFPSPLSCTIQASVYAVAEMAAELIAKGE